MKKITLAFIIIIGGILTGITVYGSQAAARAANRHDINGYSIAYYENGETVFQNFGDGISEKSVFELASNGKVLSAYIALQLVNEGKLNPDDKIASYLDASLLTDDERMYEITLKQLLCHTAGFSPSFELGIDKKLYSNPDEKFRYSGVGYIYLQNVIENVSGMTIEQAARHYVFEPFGMQNSTFEHAKTVTPYMKLSSVTLYIVPVFVIVFAVLVLLSFIVGKITNFRFFTYRSSLPVCFIAAGLVNAFVLLVVFVSKVLVVFLVCFTLMGLSLFLTRKKAKLFYAVIPMAVIFMLILGFALPVSIPVTNDIVAKAPNCAYTLKSTSEDMALFCSELMEQYHNGSGAVNDMFSAAVHIDAVNSWGLGIAIERGHSGEAYWHSGINPGFQSLFVLYPLEDKYVVVLTNSDNGLPFAKDVANAFLGVDGGWEIKR